MPGKNATGPGDGSYSIGRRVWAKFPRVDDLPASRTAGSNAPDTAGSTGGNAASTPC